MISFYVIHSAAVEVEESDLSFYVLGLNDTFCAVNWELSDAYSDTVNDST